EDAVGAVGVGQERLREAREIVGGGEEARVAGDSVEAPGAGIVGLAVDDRRRFVRESAARRAFGGGDAWKARTRRLRRGAAPWGEGRLQSEGLEELASHRRVEAQAARAFEERAERDEVEVAV